MGLRLRDAGSEGFDLCDLRDVVAHLPADSNTVRAVRATMVDDPEEEAARDMWGLDQHLLALMADSLRWLVWAKSKDATRPGAKPPDPIPRPGTQDAGSKQHKPKTSVRFDQAAQRFAVPRTTD